MSTPASLSLRTPRRVATGVAALGVIAASLTMLPSTQAAATDFAGTPAAMGSGANEVVWAIAANSTTAMAAGGFTSIGGVAATRIAQYDLATNTWSAAGTFGVAPEVLVTYPNGDIVAGGTFVSADGVANSANIAYWHAGAWSGLGDANQVLDGGVFAIDFADDGTMYVGGQFAMSSGGTGLNYVAKWSGTAWLPLGTGLNARVRSVAVDSQDNVYVAGDFTTAGGTPVSSIAMWNGSTWQALGSGLGTLASSNVDIAVDSNDDLYVVGDFSTIGGISANKAAKWDGSSWTALAGGLSLGIPFNLTVDSADQVYVVGSFLSALDAANNPVANTISLARWSGTGWQGMSPNLNGGSASAVSIGGPYGEVFLGGSFNSTNPASVTLNYVTRMQPGPTISSVTPSRVSTSGGTGVTVSGAALKGATIGITIDGVVPDNVAPISQSTLTADTKAHAAGTATLSLTTPAGTDTAEITFVSPATITGISPDAGPLAGGTTLTISGAGLTDVTGVDVGGTAATGLVITDDNELTVFTPAHVADLSDVTVHSPFGDATLSNAFRFAAAPVVANIDPGSGTSAGGTTVTISGGNFTGATRVDVGATQGVSVLVVNDTTISFETPAGAGADLGISVYGPGGTTTLAGVWDYVSPPTEPLNLQQTAKARGSMTFGWSTPASDGGSEIVGYTVQFRKHGASTWKTRSGLVTSRNVTLSNLRDGVSYDVRVAAENIQVGAYASLTATTPGLPAAPTRVTAKVRANVVTMKWTKAVVQSGSTRTANVIKCTKGSVSKKVRLAAGATSGRITLGRGTWTCKVYTYTEAGHGPGSAAKVVKVG